MKIHVTNNFKRATKRLHRNQIATLEKAIQAIQSNPVMGDLKVGDLTNVRVYKFRILHQLILLAYTYDEQKGEITLLHFASHENFYDLLKRQIKSSSCDVS